MAGPTRHSTTELHRATDDTTGAPITAGFLVAADGAGLLDFIDPATIIPTNAELNIEGGQDVIKVHGSMGSTETFDPTDGNVHTGTLTADCTVTLNVPTGSGACTLELWITQDGTGGWDITWPGSVTPDGTITADTTAGVTVRYILETIDGGSTWILDLVGGSGGSALTVKDEGSTLDAAVTSIDFVGAGVAATNASHAVTVTIPGGATASDTNIWRPVVDSTGAVILTGSGEALMAYGPA